MTFKIDYTKATQPATYKQRTHRVSQPNHPNEDKTMTRNAKRATYFIEGASRASIVGYLHHDVNVRTKDIDIEGGAYGIPEIVVATLTDAQVTTVKNFLQVRDYDRGEIPV